MATDDFKAPAFTPTENFLNSLAPAKALAGGLAVWANVPLENDPIIQIKIKLLLKNFTIRIG